MSPRHRNALAAIVRERQASACPLSAERANAILAAHGVTDCTPAQLLERATKPPRKTAKPYAYAVNLIALNDSPGSTESDPAVIAGWVSVALVADLYGREPLIVAEDVIKARRAAPPPLAANRASVADPPTRGKPLLDTLTPSP